MSEVNSKKEFSTKLKNEAFLQFADKSSMGVLIIHQGLLTYFNKRFQEIFGYSKKEIQTWKKLEYFKIIHPEDQKDLFEKIRIEDKQNSVLRFRGVKKNGDIILIENYICRIKFNNKYMYLSSYYPLEEKLNEVHIPKLIKTKEEKKIVANYHPNLIKFIEDNNIKFEIIKYSSYREED